MINFPEIDLKDKKVLVIIFVLSLMFFFFNFLETKALVSILVILLIINQFSTFKKNMNEKIISSNNKDEKLILNYNNKIATLLKEVKKYKKKSPTNYKEGMYYWTQFIKQINILENEKLHNYVQYFDKAYLYLQKATNIFQSFGVEATERKYIDEAKYNEFENSKNLMKITKVAKELYEEGYLLLYNLSLRLNKKWKENPHIMNKEIILDHPLPYDKYNSKHFDFYL